MAFDVPGSNCALLLFSHVICNSSQPIKMSASSASKDPSSAALPAVYLVQRHDFGPHYSDEIGRKHVHSIHSTKAAANKKAKVLIRAIRRDEDSTGMARLEIEQEDRLGYYYGDLELNQDMTVDTINHTEVHVVKMSVKGEGESPYSGDGDEDEFEDELNDDGYHPKEKTADDFAKEKIMEDVKNTVLGHGTGKRRRL